MAQLRYPYTLGAMLMRFPLKYHIQKSWVWKVRGKTGWSGLTYHLQGYAIGLIPTGLLYLKITNSFPDQPAN